MKRDHLGRRGGRNRDSEHAIGIGVLHPAMGLVGPNANGALIIHAHADIVLCYDEPSLCTYLEMCEDALPVGESATAVSYRIGRVKPPAKEQPRAFSDPAAVEGDRRVMSHRQRAGTLRLNS